MERLQQILVDAGYNLGKSGPNKDGVDGDAGKLTRKAAGLYAKKMFKTHNYVWTENNIISIRTNDTFTDKFSDFAIVIHKGLCVSVLKWTTKPGKYWVSNPVTVGGITGTGCMKEGQWMRSHKYEDTSKKKWGKAGYFLQYSPIEIYRDGDKDNTLDKNIITKAPTWYGFFLHAMGKGFSIWNWSAGCNGASLNDWQKYIDPYFEDGDIINYTILES